MSIPQHAPPPSFDAQQFRLALAGLTDPDSSAQSDDGLAPEYKAASIDLCVCLCDLFGRSLDRKTLWDRIASALAAASAKANAGDTDHLISMCLEHVRADASYVSAHDLMPTLTAKWADKPISWRQGWVRYISTRGYAIIAHSRLRWEAVKEERAAARDQWAAPLKELESLAAAEGGAK